jgi:hypothetical protein
VFDNGNLQGRIGTVMGMQRSFGRSTKHIIVFEGGDGAPETVLLQKTTGAAAKGCSFQVLPSGVLQAVDSVHDKVDNVHDKVIASMARMELTVQAVLETSRATGRLVEALALGELDCPKYVYVVPDTPPGGWKKGVFWFHSLHATQVRLVLACAHDFQVVACGPDGKGYPVKLEKNWVKKFFNTFGPVIKVGLFAARAAVLASGVGAFALPFLPHEHLGHDAVDEHALGDALEGHSRHMHQLHLIDEMLEKFGELAEEGAGVARVSEELGHVLESAVEEAGGPARPASEALQAWTASSYRSLRELLHERDPQLAQTGLVHAVAGGASEWVAPENVAAWEAQQRQGAERGRCPETERGDGENEQKGRERRGASLAAAAGGIALGGDDVFVRTSNVSKYTVGRHEAIARASQPSLCGVVVRLIADSGDSGPGTVTIRPDATIITTTEQPLLSGATSRS